jgi:hypothetical protein
VRSPIVPSLQGLATFRRREAYASREIRFLSVIQRDGWRVKSYAIRHRDRVATTSESNDFISKAVDSLPRSAVAVDRPGVGFVIHHQGVGADYLVLHWWDNQNECPSRVWVRHVDGDIASEPWRPAEGSEAVCVWDLQVIGFERDAFVRHVLSPPDGPDIDAYLREHLSVSV